MTSSGGGSSWSSADRLRAASRVAAAVRRREFRQLVSAAQERMGRRRGRSVVAACHCPVLVGPAHFGAAITISSSCPCDLYCRHVRVGRHRDLPLADDLGQRRTLALLVQHPGSVLVEQHQSASLPRYHLRTASSGWVVASDSRPPAAVEEDGLLVDRDAGALIAAASAAGRSFAFARPATNSSVPVRLISCCLPSAAVGG